MAAKNLGVFGIYSTYDGVQSGAAALRSAGFRRQDVAALVPEIEGSQDLVHEKRSKSPEGFMAGASIGGMAGGVLGWLFASNILRLTTLQPLVDAGVAVATFAGIGALGVLGGMVGGLIGLATPEYEALRYAGRRSTGGMLVSVHCDNREWRKRARQALQQTGAAGVATARAAMAEFAPCGPLPAPAGAASLGAKVAAPSPA
ncbi:MAG TPA: hypothetical protein VMV31_02845 [Terriglobales bacterium]|nr:hypothetical protein [Terriglobales bacterium]